MAQEPAATKTPSDVGPGSGKTSLPTNLNSPTPGEAPEGFGEAKNNKPPVNPPLESGNQPTAAANALQTDHNSPPGGTAPYPETGVMKAGSRRMGRVSHIKAAMLRKAGADSEAPSQISGSKSESITGPENQPSTVPRPAEVTSQERMIASNEAAINATPRQAAEVPKKRMGEVLTEPMQTASTDTTLQKALGSDVVNQAGTKIASAKFSALQKIASQGCQCKSQQLEKGSCGFCKIASRIERRKEAQAGRQPFVALRTPGVPR